MSSIPCSYIYSGARFIFFEKHSLSVMLLAWWRGPVIIVLFADKHSALCFLLVASQRRLVVTGRESAALSVCLVPSLVVSQDWVSILTPPSPPSPHCSLQDHASLQSSQIRISETSTIKNDEEHKVFPLVLDHSSYSYCCLPGSDRRVQ